MVNLKVTNMINNANLPKQTTYKIAIDPNSLEVHASNEKSFYDLLNIKINDKVKNTDGLEGIVSKKNNDTIFVNWNDNTIERIKLANITDGYLSYVDTIETQVSPLGTGTLNTALVDERTNSAEDNVNNDTTLETKQLQKRIADLEEQLKNKQDNSIKKHATEEIVDLAIQKGMIDEDDKDLELLKVAAFDDDTFEQYQNEVLNFSTTGEVSSMQEDQTDIPGLSKQEIEAQNMLAKRKFELGISTPKQNNVDIKTVESRSTRDVGERNQITFENIGQWEKPKSLEDALLSLDDGSMDNLSYDSMFNDNSNNNDNVNIIDDITGTYELEKTLHKQANVSHGITKPLIMGQSTPAYMAPTNSNFSELFSQLNWTTLKSR